VYGTAHGADDLPIAVAVNGVIGGVGARLTDGDGSDFAALPPDWLWHDGANDVDIFTVSGDGTLHQLDSSR
jgi:hypothetical protein